MKSTYLVTGGSGFLGAACVKALIARGHRVRVLDNNLRGRERRLKDVWHHIEMIAGDVRDPAVVRRAVMGVDEVIHFAFLNGTEYFYKYPELVLDIGIRGMLNILDACRTELVGRLVVASSSEAYQQPPILPTPENVALVVPDVLNPRFSYGGGKLITELMAVNWGRTDFERVIIFRPHNIYGPDMGWEHVIPQFAMRILDLIARHPNGTLSFDLKGGGKQTRAFCHVADFTNGLLALLDHGSHLNVYNIGNPEEISIEDLANRIAKYFHREIEINSTESFAGETSRRCPDITKLRGLGYSPRISLDEGLADALLWYTEHVDLRSDRMNLEQAASR